MTFVAMGGTYDPIHNGHIASALHVSQLLGDLPVTMIPSQLPPHRQAPAASAEHRWAMLKLATANSSKLLPDDRELKRQGHSYTLDTLTSIRQELDSASPLIFVLGSDAYNTLGQWRGWQQVTDLAHLLILARPNHALATDEAVAQWACNKQTSNKDDLLQQPAGHIMAATLTQVEVSATAVRQAVAMGQPLSGMVPDAVASYIHLHGLYLGSL